MDKEISEEVLRENEEEDDPTSDGSIELKPNIARIADKKVEREL